MDWDDQAGGWDEDPSVRAYAAAAFGSLEREARRRGSMLGGDRALDFGCGTGLLMEHLVDRYDHIDGVDTSAGMREILAQKVAAHGWGHVEVHGAIPEAAQRYDLIVCSSVCAFLEDYPGTVAELSERLVPGGLFVQWDWELDPSEPEPAGLDRDAITAALRRAGLLEVAVEVAFTIGDEPDAMRPLIGSGTSPLPA